MRMMAGIAGLAALVAAPLMADFTYQETSTITGGAMMSMMRLAGVFSKQAREPIVSTVSIKGDRMVHKSNTTATVIDLGSQTITSIDFQKKQYSVMTFEEMKQALEAAMQKMQKKDAPEMNFKVSADPTGKTKQAAGFAAKELIMKMEMQGTDQKSGQTGGMTITTDMWIAQGVPGYQEVRDFHRKMAEKLNWTPGGNMFMANPQVSKGMAEVAKEVAKLDGVPVEQFITMGASGTATGGQGQEGGAPQQEQQPQQQQQQQQQAAPPSVGGAIGSALGGRFGLGRKKSQSQPQEQQQQPAQGGEAPAQKGGTPGALLEMNTVMSGFSTGSADESLFAVPAGFKKVDSEMKKMH